MSNIKCQNLVIFFTQNTSETYIFAINRLNIMKKSKYQQYFYYFVICILVPYAFWFSYQNNMVTILINTEFKGAVLIRGETTIRWRRLFQCGYPKNWHLFESRRLLEKMRYFYFCPDFLGQNFKIYDVINWETINYNTHITQNLQKQRQSSNEIYSVNGT